MQTAMILTMASFLEVLVESEELHELSCRADLLKRRCLMNNTGALVRPMVTERV